MFLMMLPVFVLGCAEFVQLNEITVIYNFYNHLGNCLMQCFASIRMSNYSWALPMDYWSININSLNINNLDFNAIAGWSSIISLGISCYSLYLIGTIRSNVVGLRRKSRLRQLFNEIKTIQNDAIPLSEASKSKFESLERNLPSDSIFVWSSKNKAVRDIKAAIKSEDISSVKEGIEDFISHFEDL